LSTPSPSEHGHDGLPSRPGADPLVAALVAAAALELWPAPPDEASDDESAVSPADATRAWRLSGRWWTRPALRRDRPWVR